jgi:hypothetical protein
MHATGLAVEAAPRQPKKRVAIAQNSGVLVGFVIPGRIEDANP